MFKISFAETLGTRKALWKSLLFIQQSEIGKFSLNLSPAPAG